MFYQFEPIGEENTFQEFCKDLLNLKYGISSFQLYKEKGASQHGIDNYSTEIRIVSQSKKKKLTRADKTLEKELINDFDECMTLIKNLPIEFDRFILLSNTKKYGNVQNHAVQLSQKHSFEVEFWSWDDIQPSLVEFEQLRKKYFPHLWHSVNQFPKVLTYIPKVDENEVVGRLSELIELGNLINVSNKVVLVNGMGGVGKSTLAKLFVNKNSSKYTHTAWVDVLNIQAENRQETSSLMEAFVNNSVLVQNLHIEFKDDDSIEDKYSLIMNKLQNITGQNLLVIDNAPASIFRFTDKFPGPPNWKILLTSREHISEYAILEIDVLNTEDAKTLFYQFYKIEKDERIVYILSYIGNHTLTIELLAKTANKRQLSINELINYLKKEGLNISKSAKITTNHDRHQKGIKLFEYLLDIFSLSNLSNTQQDILRYFSILPSQLLPYQDLKILFCIPEDDNSFFDDLDDATSKGWLRNVGREYQMHQVIQEVLRTKLIPDYTNCKVIVEALCKLLHFEYKESFINKIPYIKIAEHIIANLYKKQPEFASLINNVAVLLDYSGDSLTAIKYYEELIDLNKQNSANIEADNWVYYINISTSWLRLGEYSKALFYSLKSIAFLESSSEHKNSLELAMSFNNVAENYRHLGEINKGLEFNWKAIRTFESTELGNKHAELATAYNNLANSYSELEDHKMALKYSLKAFELRKEVLEKDHPYLAQSYNNVGVYYEKLGEFDKALTFHSKAIEIRERIYKVPHYDLSESYNNLGELFRAMADFEQAITYHLKSIKIREAVFAKGHPEISKAYGILGGVYLFRQDLTNAKKYFQIAVDMRLQSGHKDPQLGMFYLNYATAYFLENNLDEASQLTNKATDIYLQFFTKNHPHYKMAIQLKEAINNKQSSKDPQVLIINKLGRNEPCFCNSGKKYKNCHGQ